MHGGVTAVHVRFDRRASPGLGVKRTKTAIEEDGLILVDGNVSSNPSSAATTNDLDDVDESVEKEKVACAVPLLAGQKQVDFRLFVL